MDLLLTVLADQDGDVAGGFGVLVYLSIYSQSRVGISRDGVGLATELTRRRKFLNFIYGST